MTADVVCDALAMAWFMRKPVAGLAHHSDRDSQYASHTFQSKLVEFGMICSMSRKSECWNNALTESFFNILKNERGHGVPCGTRVQAMADTFKYMVVFCNRKGRHYAWVRPAADEFAEPDPLSTRGKGCGTMSPNWKT
jgi:putative transposase